MGFIKMTAAKQDVLIVVNNMLNQLIQIANTLDQKGETGLADEIDAVIKGLIISKEPKKSKKKKKPKDKAGIDEMVGANGYVGTGVTDNSSAGMFQGLSDAYFYSSYQNLEGAYGPQDR